MNKDSTARAARAQALLNQQELVPARIAELARAFADQVLEDPGLGALVHVLEVEIFQQWLAATNDDERDAALALHKGMQRLLVKLRELAQNPPGAK